MSASYEGRDLEASVALENYQRWIAERFRPYFGKSYAEIGAGTGNFARVVVDEFDEAVCVEPSANLIDPLTRAIGSSARVDNASAEGWLAAQPRSRFDTLCMVNVLEHIKDDVGVLREMKRVLSPSGHILIYVPAVPFLYSPFDKAVGHYRRYTRESLSSAFRRADLHIEHMAYTDTLGVLPWLVIQRLLKRKEMSPTAASVYDAVGVPLARKIEARWRMPIGKNLIAVAS